MSGTLEVTLKLVPGTANRQWEATAVINGAQDIFRGSLTAVLAALQATLSEIGAESLRTLE